MSDQIADWLAQRMLGNKHQPGDDIATRDARVAQSYLPRSVKRKQYTADDVATRQNAALGLSTSLIDPGNIPSAVLGLVSPEARDAWRSAQSAGGDDLLSPGGIGKLLSGVGVGGAAINAGAKLAGAGGAAAAGSGFAAGSDIIEGSPDRRTVGKAMLGAIPGITNAAGAVGTGGVGFDLATGGKAIDYLGNLIFPSAHAAKFDPNKPVDLADPEQIRGAQDYYSKLGVLRLRNGPDGKLTEGGPSAAIIQDHNRRTAPPPPPPNPMDVAKANALSADADVRAEQERSRLRGEEDARKAELDQKRIEQQEANTKKSNASYREVWDPNIMENPLVQFGMMGAGGLLGYYGRGKLSKKIAEEGKGEAQMVTGIGLGVPAKSGSNAVKPHWLFGGGRKAEAAQDEIPGIYTSGGGKVVAPKNETEAVGALAPAMTARSVLGQKNQNWGDPIKVTDSYLENVRRGNALDPLILGGTYGLYAGTGSLAKDADKALDEKRRLREQNPTDLVANREYESARLYKELLETGRKFELGALMGLGGAATKGAFVGRLNGMSPRERVEFGLASKRISEAEMNGLGWFKQHGKEPPPMAGAGGGKSIDAATALGIGGAGAAVGVPAYAMWDEWSRPKPKDKPGAQR